MEVIILLLFLFVLIYVSMKEMELNKRGITIFNEWNGFFFVMCWLVFGFLTRQDVSHLHGCFMGYNGLLGFRNVIFSSISAVLLIWAVLTARLEKRRLLVGIEIIYSIFKIYFLKGSYESFNYCGLFNVEMIAYDYVSMVLRCFLFASLINIKEYRVPLSWSMSYLIIMLKTLCIDLHYRLM